MPGNVCTRITATRGEPQAGQSPSGSMTVSFMVAERTGPDTRRWPTLEAPVVPEAAPPNDGGRLSLPFSQRVRLGSTQLRTSRLRPSMRPTIGVRQGGQASDVAARL